MKAKILVLASGTKDGGGSGFENLVVQARSDVGSLKADIVGVVSNHQHGGVRKRADNLQIPFEHLQDPFTADAYKELVQWYGAEWIALSGWLKPVQGLDSDRTFNIHPALLSFDNRRFGGKGMYGHHVHEAVKKAFDRGEITCSGVTMHFVTDEYDRGPIFFEYRVPLDAGMSADEIGAAVNKAEHEWQPRITNMVVHGLIKLVGDTIMVPMGYPHLPRR